jgi:FixJ family two-component response regulator
MQSHGVGSDIIYVAVVDDDESLCRSFSRLLRTAGFQPVAYPSAEAFLEDTKRPHFDCLVLDIQLGGMSGLELSRRLAAVRDATPVIFITAHDDPEVQSEALARGCDGYFHKHDPGPLVMEAIWRAVRVAPDQDAKSARPSGNPITKNP